MRSRVFDNPKIVRRGQAMLVLLAALGMGAGSASAAVLNVGTCLKGTTYATIGAAVSAAQAGDTVSVCPGTYPEIVTITKNITVVGKAPSGGNYPTVTFPPDTDSQCAGPFSEECPQIIVENATASIQRLHLDGSGFLSDCNSTPIGIAFYNASGAADFNDIRNEASSCADEFTAEIRILVDHSGIGVEAELLLLPGFGAGTPVPSKVEASGNYIDNTGLAGVAMANVTGNVLNNSIGVDYGRDAGIHFRNAGGSTALNNTIWGTGSDAIQTGILVEGSPKTNVIRNTITNIEDGIVLEDTNSSTLNGNGIKDAFDGMILACSSNNSLVSNSVNDYSMIDGSAGANLFDCEIDPGSDNNLLNGNKFNGLCAGILTGTVNNTGNTFLNNAFTNIGPGDNIMKGNSCEPF